MVYLFAVLFAQMLMSTPNSDMNSGTAPMPNVMQSGDPTMKMADGTVMNVSDMPNNTTTKYTSSAAFSTKVNRWALICGWLVTDVVFISLFVKFH